MPEEKIPQNKTSPAPPQTKEGKEEKQKLENQPSTSNKSLPNPPLDTVKKEDTATLKAQEVKDKAVEANIANAANEEQAQLIASLKDTHPNIPASELVLNAEAKVKAKEAELDQAKRELDALEDLEIDEEDLADSIESKLESLGSPQPYFVYDRDTKVEATVLGPGSNGLGGSIDLQAMIQGQVKTFYNVREDSSGTQAGTFHLRDKVKPARIVSSQGVFDTFDEPKVDNKPFNTLSITPNPQPPPQGTQAIPVK